MSCFATLTGTFYLNLLKAFFNSTLTWRMMKNGQTYCKKMFGHFSSLWMKGLPLA